jgi:hypothetical protein
VFCESLRWELIVQQQVVIKVDCFGYFLGVVFVVHFGQHFVGFLQVLE